MRRSPAGEQRIDAEQGQGDQKEQAAESRRAAFFQMAGRPVVADRLADLQAPEQRQADQPDKQRQQQDSQGGNDCHSVEHAFRFSGFRPAGGASCSSTCFSHLFHGETARSLDQQAIARLQQQDRGPRPGSGCPGSMPTGRPGRTSVGARRDCWRLRTGHQQAGQSRSRAAWSPSSRCAASA